MSALMSRTAPVSSRDLDPALAQANGPRRRRNRLVEWMRAHAATLAWLIPVVAVAAVVNGFNLAGWPAISASEITTTMQAWGVNNLGRLTPYTYTWQNPPLGWLQISAWTGLTGGFSRYSVAVVAVREAMVASTVVSVILLWFVARRVGLGRSAAGVATILFALSPLALDFHRVASLDNVATPWLLASLLLATTRRNQLLAFIGSAAALAVAVLSQETYLLALPLVGFLAWRSAHVDTRRYVMAVATAVLVVILGVYVMVAVIEGDFLPSANHPSLIGGLQARFGGGAANSSQLVASIFGQWRSIDPVLFFGAPAAAIAGLFIRRIRPFAVAFIGLVALALVFGLGGYLPGTDVVILLPLAALVIAGVVDRIVRAVRPHLPRRSLRLVAALVVSAIAIGALVPAWSSTARDLAVRNNDQPALRQAETWVAGNVPKNSRLLVDNSMWIDLVRAGFSTDNVIWFPKLDSDPAVKAQSPQGWKDADYVVVTPAMRADSNATQARSAITNSTAVASFGTASQQIQIRKIDPVGIATARSDEAKAQSQRAALGAEIDANPLVIATSAATTRLRAGDVDPRIPLLVAQLATSATVTVSRLPVVAGESGHPIREVVISRVGGNALTSNGHLTPTGRAVAASLKNPYSAQSISAAPDGLLIEFPLGLPAGIIQ
jgi:4-amino-4-deoxy-L-arabinose transferase-like glycosyltransferase